MNLRDPARPQINHHPAIMDSKGRAVFPFTGVTVDIYHVEPGWVRCSFMAKNERGAYSWQTAIIPTEDLQQHLWDLSADPENVMALIYNYTPPTESTTPPKPTPPTLEDLGLV